jgi:hypothetical protein
MDSEKGDMFRKSIVTKFRSEYNIKNEEDIKSIMNLADLVLMEFNGKEIADDDFVNPEIRDVLYQLEAMDLLKMDITEKHIRDGRVWKKHYWVLNEREMKEVNKQDCPNGKDCLVSDPFEFYKKLPEELWINRHKDGYSGAV